MITAKGVSLPVVDGINMTCDADLRAEWSEHGGEDEEPSLPKVSGDVVLTSFSYTRPSASPPTSDRSLSAGAARCSSPTILPTTSVTFDVKLRSRDPLRLRNNLVEAQLMVDSDALVFSGTNQRFGLRGRMRIMPGGRIRLRANEFEVRQGYVRFDDLDPHRAERRCHRGHRIPALFGAARAPGCRGRTGRVRGREPDRRRLAHHAARLRRRRQPPARHDQRARRSPKKTSCCS